MSIPVPSIPGLIDDISAPCDLATQLAAYEASLPIVAAHVKQQLRTMYNARQAESALRATLGDDDEAMDDEGALVAVERVSTAVEVSSSQAIDYDVEKAERFRLEWIKRGSNKDKKKWAGVSHLGHDTGFFPRVCLLLFVVIFHSK
jgi:hypothetical protein